MEVLICCMTVIACGALKAQEIKSESTIEAEQAALWRNQLEESRGLPIEQKFDKLMLGLRNMGYRKSFEGHSEEIASIFSELQSEFLKAPNHAKYFHEKIEQARAKLPEGTRWHSGEHNSFQSYRVMIIRDTLSHIPSPEVVMLLGEYLYDERDTPPPIRPGQDWIDSNSSAYMACRALQKIGLKNAPLPRRASENADNLATWKLWWGPIEAGNRTFSFEGQDVEYRFRKDGSYETLSRDAVQKRITNSAAGEIENTPTKLGKLVQRWLILLGGCAALFAWLRWQSKHKKT
jgi:hypothetical protein